MGVAGVDFFPGGEHMQHENKYTFKNFKDNSLVGIAQRLSSWCRYDQV